jgi:hypothetical protein
MGQEGSRYVSSVLAARAPDRKVGPRLIVILENLGKKIECFYFAKVLRIRSFWLVSFLSNKELFPYRINGIVTQIKTGFFFLCLAQKPRNSAEAEFMNVQFR